ncbi:HIRAN domain-containing protein [Trichoderma breve]|uniref:HIRAN domain-containing protein n=1 Tax=Trichoderma breve TaxID=2034170 RepID=A0A9W9B2G1_9HYPO|nr:HIRAN domain-containing protein [Trichoderma breve]KAJ4854442.1 HIRAN domain-containing protein [Trichoderma breve]
MELGSSQEPPIKRRRFFKDPDEPSSDPVFSPKHEFSSSLEPRRFFKTEDEDDEKEADDGDWEPESEGRSVNVKAEEKSRDVLPELPRNGSASGSSTALEQPHQAPTNEPIAQHESSAVTFDKETFESFVGCKVAANILRTIQQHCGNNLERAVNMYFDGTYKKLLKSKPAAAGPSRTQSPDVQSQPSPLPIRRNMPTSRYIGAFGVEGWATRSGTNLLKHGEKVKIERQKIQPPPPPKTKPRLGAPPTPVKMNTAASRRIDVIVRFTNQSGQEIGRLAKDTANWVSTLMDQKICKFEGTCVYCPERTRTNDTIFIQLRCSLLDSAFFDRSFKPANDSSATWFEQQIETAQEKELRLRQVALVRLFQEINLQPVVANAAAKDGRKGLLQAAEMDEQKQKDSKKTAANGNKESGNSSPSEEAEEGEELEQDQLDALYKKAQTFDFSMPEVDPASTFAMTLRPYQRQSLHWMIAKEKDEQSHREPSMHPLWEEYLWPLKDVDDKDLPTEQHCLGGILADEMGLGKTIQMLSLIHSHRSEVSRQARSSPKHGLNQLQRLGKNSSNVLEAPCTTLVVAPMSLLSQWQSEAEKASLPGTMKIQLYYGAEKALNLQSLCSGSNAPDLVITSYGVVLSEFTSIAAKNGDRSFHTGIFSLKFFRVILDEAHYIKNRASKTARACYEIAADHRWALTGTPIVNRLEDLFSLSGDFVRALDVVQTVLEPLVTRRTKDMKTPDGQPLVQLPPKQIDIVEVELSKTERDIYDHIFNKVKNTFAQNVEAGTVLKAFTTIFAQIMRLRQSCCHPVLVRNKDIVADEEEAGAAADAATGLGDDMDLESLITQFTAITDEVTNDRQTYGAHALDEIRNESEKECPLCFDEPMNEQIVTGCWHSACKKCLMDFIKHETDHGRVPKCFNCRTPINQRDLFEVVRHDEADEPFASAKPRFSLQRLGVNSSSAKVAALISELRTLRRDRPYMKSIIFSQFTSFLTLIEAALTRANVKFLRLDGSMTQRARAAVLQQFTESKGFTVMLMSLRAGGVGLNLTSAGRVFMMDPWWSYAVELQAIDRVHRLGQQDEVVVKRFIVRGSVEERMLKIQDRKKFIATSLGMMNDEEKKLQRIEDIKELLS